MSSRRQFLKASSAFAVASTFPVGAPAWGAPLRSQLRALDDATHRIADAGVPHADDPASAALVAAALDGAQRAGATYADVRFQVTERRNFFFQEINFRPPLLSLNYGIGVRALSNGYWGYSVSSISALTPDMTSRLGREAGDQARQGATGRTRSVELAPTAAVASGSWTTPIDIDPFTMPWEEQLDQMNGMLQYVGTRPFQAGAQIFMDCVKNVVLFASTDGTTCTQTLYNTDLKFRVAVGAHWRTQKTGMRDGDSFVSARTGGWEDFVNAPFERELPRMIAQASDARFAKPAEVGRYDVVFDGAALAKIADLNIGAATELDRAMTYLANSEGTSYLTDPLAMVGTHTIGSSLLNVTANRSMPKGAATVKWDDEGVEPDEAVLVKDGILTDFQTTRESASWLKDYYAKTGQAVRSHGGAMHGDWRRTAPEQGAHNLRIAPAPSAVSFEDLCSGVKNGLAVLSGTTRADQQMLNAETTGDIVYEIKNGKLGRVVEGGVLLTRAPDFWKKLVALGGAETVCHLGLADRDAQGRRKTPHTVSAPAALIKQVAVTTNVARTL